MKLYTQDRSILGLRVGMVQGRVLLQKMVEWKSHCFEFPGSLEVREENVEARDKQTHERQSVSDSFT